MDPCYKRVLLYPTSFITRFHCTLFPFTTPPPPHDVLQMCHTTFNSSISWSSQSWRLSVSIKEEIRNRFNLISEERVKNFEQNSENLTKIGWKIRKLWHFEVSQIFKKTFSWPVDMNMQMSELMMSSPHNFPFILYTEMTKISYSAKMRMLDLP